MNAQDRAILNTIKYGTANPGLWKRIVSKVLGNGLFFERHSTEFWQALFQYQKATKKQLLTEGYAKNVTVYSVVTTIARTAAQAPWAVYKVKSTTAFNRLKSLQQQPYSIKRDLDIAICKEEALELHKSHYLNQVLLTPNSLQGQAEYMENLLGYKLATGDSYEYAELQSEGSKKVQSFWVAPSDKMRIYTDEYGVFPMRERLFKLEIGAREKAFGTNEISHSKYWSPFFNGDGDHLYGFSPLEAAWIATLQGNSAGEASVEQLKNRGPRGIFTFDSPHVADSGKWATLKADLHNEWQQNTKNYKDKIMPAFAKGQWHKVGLSLSELSIIELNNMTSKDICNAYGVSEILFNNSQSSTYDNYNQARKELITRCVLPLLSTIRAARNRKMVPNGDWNDSGEHLVFDFDSTIYTELFDDVWQMAKDMRTVGAYTDNEIRIATNYERIENPLMDDIWKKTNDVPMSMINENTITGNRNGQENGNNQEAGRTER